MRPIEESLRELVDRPSKESPQQRTARRKYEHALRRHEADIANAERAFDEKLRDPEVAMSLGLPAELPEFTVEVMRTTMALDRRGSERPTLAKFLDKFV